VRENIDYQLEHAARRANEDPGASLAAFSAELRCVVAESCREILGKKVQARSSRSFAVGDALEQARRGSGLFLLQYRLLEPALTRPDERREAILRRYVRP